MNQIVHQIFRESGFQVGKEGINTQFYEKVDQEHESYYLVHYVDVNDLKSYFDNKKFENIQELFSEIKETKADIAKNTSLIVIAKSDNIETDSQKYKNDTLQIEEDEFWFKKYVLIYSDESVASFSESISVIEDLKTCILNNTQFTSFKGSLHNNSEYFVVVQIFLKFPFLRVPTALHEQYLSISDILGINLSASQSSLLEAIINHSDRNNENYWTLIKQASYNIEDSELLNQLFLKFKGNDKD